MAARDTSAWRLRRLMSIRMDGIPEFWSTGCMTSKTHGSFLEQPRVNEIRVVERDGRRWLQQWRMPPHGHYHERAWIDVAELGQPLSNVRPLRP